VRGNKNLCWCVENLSNRKPTNTKTILS
jgi:hypothetical protein